jgi:predicted GIY-YIG superfamily endonuclease
MFFVYILLSLKNKRSYVGMTGKIPQTRLEEHNFIQIPGQHKMALSN